MLTSFAMIVITVLGFLAGLLTFKVKSRWCRTCGATLGCVECRDRVRSRAVRR